ncbi:alpha/beta hydrolase [Pseudenhygromyxa sp. WMMC2535]|uniref:alpha/beta fold hydrolase n=1 Tax=Pseudenhygromyxa sp. WMMC2535 TaxID=2712867 RepID=UPI0015518469|nr:alpha/beta hydrolase [Pseudenhygromyxa sp. WMMC2535]
MSAAEELTIETPELRVAARAWGPADGRPVLALHGWLDNAASYDGLGPRLAAAGLRLVCLDLPGHGYSQHKPGSYHFVDWVADILAVVEALGWQRFMLVGHSMGAGISVLFAGTFPERVERLILLEGMGPLSEAPEQVAKRLARSLRVEARKRALEDRRRLYPSIEEAAERLMESTAMRPASAMTLVARGMVGVPEAAPEGWTWRADAKLRLDSRLRLSEAQVHVFLRAIACPTLLVRASEGWPHDAALARARVACIPALELVTLDGHHHVHLDEPEAVAAVALPFLSRPSSSNPSNEQSDP